MKRVPVPLFDLVERVRLSFRHVYISNDVHALCFFHFQKQKLDEYVLCICGVGFLFSNWNNVQQLYYSWLLLQQTGIRDS